MNIPARVVEMNRFFGRLDRQKRQAGIERWKTMRSTRSPLSGHRAALSTTMSTSLERRKITVGNQPDVCALSRDTRDDEESNHEEEGEAATAVGVRDDKTLNSPPCRKCFMRGDICVMRLLKTNGRMRLACSQCNRRKVKCSLGDSGSIQAYGRITITDLEQ
jgi:hypothetical protein